MDETVARRIDYRVIRPDGNLICSHTLSSVEGWVPTAHRDGTFWPPGTYRGDASAPPFLIQRLDGDDWVTIETSKVTLEEFVAARVAEEGGISWCGCDGHLRLRAERWADHPDYDERWRP